MGYLWLLPLFESRGSGEGGVGSGSLVTVLVRHEDWVCLTSEVKPTAHSPTTGSFDYCVVLFVRFSNAF